MKRIILSLCLFLFLFPLILQAQPYIDLVNVRYYSMPEKSKLLNDGKTSNTEWITTGIELPFKLKDDYLLISPFFEKYSIAQFNTDLYGVVLPVTFIKQWHNKQWQTAFSFIPRINSDFNSISSNDYQLGGAVIAIYKKKESLKYKFGVYYNSEYFGFFMLPLLGIEWKINESMNLFGILPSNMNLEYKTGKHIYTGVAVQFITNSYRLFNDYYYRIDDNHLKLYSDFYLTKNLVLTAEVGHSVLRKYTLGFRNEGIKTSTDLIYEDGVIFRAGLSWRIRFEDKKVISSQ